MNILPTIHLNGSSPERLRDDYSTARNAVRAALRAVESIDFNGRDYYPQGPNAFRLAQLAHESRCNNLLAVARELEEIELHIQDQIDAREAQRK